MKKSMRKLYNSEKINNFRELVDRYKKNFFDKTAFIYKENPNSIEHKKISYNTFVSDIEALGTALLSLNLENKKIAILSPNRYEWCVSYLSITTSNMVVVPLDKSLPENEIIDLIKRSEVEAAIFDKKYISVFEKILKDNPQYLKYCICMDDSDNFISYKSLIQNGNTLLSNGSSTYSNIKIDNQKMSIMLFTSGTTSISKAVALSQSNICEDIYALSQMTIIKKSDTFLSFLPLHHTFESTCTFLYGTFSGITIAFCDGIKYIQKNLVEFKITGFVCVPLMLEVMYKKIQKGINEERKTKISNSYE